MSSLIRSLPEDSWQVFLHQYGSNVITDTLLCSFPKAVFPMTEEVTSHQSRWNDARSEKNRWITITQPITPIVPTSIVPPNMYEGFIWD
jgi:hypothetical protein